MLLENKNAVIYGAGGSMGGGVARAFAREGARVFLVGRTLSKLEALAGEINQTGGRAEAAVVDALDEQSIEDFLKYMVKEASSVDISFNLIDLGAAQGTMLVDMKAADFTTPVTTAMNTHFLTSTAAGRHMAQQGSGVILALTAQAGRKPYLESGGFGVACAAIEGLCRQLAAELGPKGVRVVCLRSSGSPDAPGVREAMKLHAAGAGVSLEAWEAGIAEKTLLKRLPKLAEVSNAAVIMASEHARAITAAVTNLTCGELVD
jgi:3-oxoacyl-[acyl-carrier protein] reductase